MPKKTKEEKEEEKRLKKEKKAAGAEGENGEEEKGGGLLIFFVAFLIFIVWLAIAALLIKMDVGGFGSTVAYPVIKDIPVLNMILPEVEVYEEEDDPYGFASMAEAVDRIKYLEKELAKAKKKNKSAKAKGEEYVAIENELQKYKQEEENFEKIKQKFYEEVVYSDKAPDIESYKEYYESIEPQNAEKLYKQVVKDLQEDAELADYVAAYSSMKPDEAAGIFNTMTKNLSLVAKILTNMDKEARSKILGKMDPETAAAVTRLMEP
ncbi:MAG: hypothetical protein K6F00_10330 [Lachnospiraceae bacterium]|nr:hypothetical protein [Lachnospiraceae bacterium]